MSHFSNPTAKITACVTDVPLFAFPSYRWNTSDPAVVSIDSPSERTTRMQCHFPKALHERPSLSLEVKFSGCALRSYYSFDSDGDVPGDVSLTFSIPEVLFCNDDDDNNDGTADYIEPIDLLDEDVRLGRLTFTSPHPTNGTIVIDGILGYDGGFGDNGLIYADRRCTEKIEEGAEFPIVDSSHFVQDIYFNAAAIASTSCPGVQIRARWQPERGSDVVASGYTTIVSPTVEPICNETTNVVVDGITRQLALNPCGVGVGREAYFKIGVKPESFPDEKIVWQADGGLEFVGGNAGRAVTVRGVAKGPASLQIRMREGNFDHPEFPLYVTACTNIPIHAVIVRDEGKIA